MKTLSDAKMQELKSAILVIDEAKRKAKEAAEAKEQKKRAAREAQSRKRLQKLQKVLEFDYPNAGKDLLKIMQADGNFYYSGKYMEKIVDALIDKRLSEDDFAKVMKGRLAYVFDDKNVGKKFIQAVIDSKVSVLFIYNYLEEKGVSEWYVKRMLLQAVADKKLPFKVALLMQKHGDTLDEDLLVKAYMNGSMTPADMGSLLEYGLTFTEDRELKMVRSLIKGKNPVEMLHPFANENYRLGDLACELIVKKIVEGKLSSGLIMRHEWRVQLFDYQDCVLDVLKAVVKGKLSENLLEKIVEDEEVHFTHGVWDELFASGNPVCVKRYLQKYYPELESKI